MPGVECGYCLAVSIRRVVRGTGIALVAAGVLVLLFVAYELWGTGFTTAAHQRALRAQFEHQLQEHRHPASTQPPGGATTTTTTVPITGVQQPVAAPLGDGAPVGILDIPKIGVNFVVVEGTDTADLIKGPGHYTGTAMPGNPGNAAIAGHRTTYLHPFYNLDGLAPGDPIYITTLQGRFQYDVTSTVVVDPSDVSVLAPTATPTLTLTTCNPRYSASTRLVVKATLVSPVVAPQVVANARPRHDRTGAATSADDQLAGQVGSWGGALWWGLGCVALAAGALLVHRRLRRWWVYAAGGAGMLVLLFFFFGAVNPLLPAGY